MSSPSLSLKQFRCLLAIAETQHFRIAAEQLGISQPTLTAQIQNLEAALGLRVVERNRSGVALTAVGREIASHARQAVDAAQAMADLAANANKGALMGTVRLGASLTLGPYIMPHAVARLHRDHKDLRLYIREGTPRELSFDLARGAHDMILAQIASESRDFVIEPLFQEPLYFAVARDHPLSQNDHITGSDLKNLDILSLGPTFLLYDQAKEICDAYGANLRQDYEGTSLDALRQMAGMGMGAVFLPALYVRSEIRSRSEIAVKQFKGRNLTRPVGLVRRKSTGRTSAFVRIAETIKAVARDRFSDILED